MHSRSRRMVIAVALVLGGCAPSYRYTATSTPRPAKEAACDVRVAASMPTEGYEEIGVLEASYNPTQAISVFKNVIAPQACAAGGDLVVTQVNGVGSIVRAVVFVKRRVAAAGPAPSGSLN